jgi:hypothetical protein
MTHRRQAQMTQAHTLSGTRYVFDDLAAASAPERVAGADGAGRRAAHDDPRREPPDLRITRNSVDSLPPPL